MIELRKCILLGLIFLCAHPSLSFAFRFPDTGQTTCYQASDPSAEIPCEGTGQDGAYNINPMSYSDNGDGTVTDNNTGLMWQKQDDGIGYYNWYQASGTYHGTYNPSSQNVCGSITLGGYFDWRLPTVKELVSIVNYAVLLPGPVINTTYFPQTRSNYYSTSDMSWSVNFLAGQPWRTDASASRYVRCVRGLQRPPEVFGDNGDGSVTDYTSGLMWQKGEGGLKTWDAAASYCEALSLGGNDDWRLPNIKELQSLTDYTRSFPPIDRTYFPGVYYAAYWTSTTVTYYASGAWCINYLLGDGEYNDCLKGNASADYVRCVRGGQADNIILYIKRAGYGAGSVTSDSGAIVWDGKYGASISSHGRQVTLSAIADSGSAFAGWTGSGCPGNGTCQVTMDTSKSVTAEFCRLNTYYADLGGGVGDPNVTIQACTQPDGYVTVQKGDADGIGGITIADALLTVRYVAGLNVAESFYLWSADVNCDGEVNIIDALFLARKAVGLTVPKWCGP